MCISICIHQSNAPDEGVNPLDLDVVHAGHGVLDLLLAGLQVDNEDQGVGLLNLLHRRLGGQGVLQDGILVQLGQAGSAAHINLTQGAAERCRSAICQHRCRALVLKVVATAEAVLELMGASASGVLSKAVAAQTPAPEQPEELGMLLKGAP